MWNPRPRDAVQPALVARLHLSPLVEVLALIMTLALAPVDFTAPLRGLEVAGVRQAELDLACHLPACMFRVSSRGLQQTDAHGCALAPTRRLDQWPLVLAELRGDFEATSACLLFVEDDVDAQTMVGLVDVAIGAGFPSLSVSLSSPSCPPHALVGVRP